MTNNAHRGSEDSTSGAAARSPDGARAEGEALKAAARVPVVPPALAVPSLAGAGDEAVDASTIAFLSQRLWRRRWRTC